MSLFWEGTDVSSEAMQGSNGRGIADVIAASGAYPTERRWDRVMRMMSNIAQMLINLISTNALSATSVTSNTVGTGSNRTFTTQTGKGFLPGMRLVICRTSDPTGQRMIGTVVSYSTDQLVFSPTQATGAGTWTDWSIYPQQGTVDGPASSTSGGLMKFGDTTGKLIATVASWVFDGSDNISAAGKELQNVVLLRAREKVQQVTATATTTIDYNLGSVVELTHGVDITTFSVSNWPSSGFAFIHLIRKKDATGTPRSITWPAAVKWSDGNVAPTLTQVASAYDEFTLSTINGGTTIQGSVRGLNFGV